MSTNRCVFHALHVFLFTVAACGVAALAPSCAQDVGDVDRRQTGLLNKSVFEGEWYVRRTVVDVPYDAGYTFVGETDELQRIRWEIQKEHLLALRAHPLVENTESAAPVAVFAIEGHFDVIRDYNPATGEQTNVILENSLDRLWYERGYIRVDWSKNLVQNFSFAVEGLAQEPVAYAVEELGDPDRFLIGVRQPDGSWTDEQDPSKLVGFDHADYFDVVTKMLVSPETIEVEDYDGTILAEPACWYYLNYDCAPAIVAVRASFLRVDAAHTDYEPLEFPDNRIARDEDGTVFVRWNEDGDLERTNVSTDTPEVAVATDYTPDDPYAPSAKNPVRLPFFDKFGYFRTERFSYDEQYDELQSERQQYIQRWNLWKRSYDEDGKPLPYAERGYRPIVYYLSPDFPDSLTEVAQRSVDQWDESLRATVDALDGDGTPPRMFELRPNSRQVDPATGEVLVRGEAIGDLRYSHLYLVTAPTRAGLLGYGPAAADPLTGEIISADAYIYLGGAELLAARGRDIVELINGQIDPVDLALGEHIRGYLDKLAKGGAPLQGVSREKVKEFAKNHPVTAASHPGAPGGTGSGGKPVPASTAKNASDALKRPAGWADAKLLAVRGTALDTMLSADPQVVFMRALGQVPGASDPSDLPAALRNHLSPTHWAQPSRRRRSLDRLRFFSERNIMKAEFFDDAVAGLALDMLGEDPDAIWEKLVAAVVRSTAEHEIGHTLGLRHNFEGSTDALNYHDEYWDLRGEDAEPLAGLSEQEREGRLREYQYSSIMDYAGRFNADIMGLGHYDHAAIKFGYGQLVEAFVSPPEEPLTDVVEVADGQFARMFSLDRAIRKFRHYTSLPLVFGGVEGMRSRVDVPYTDEVAELMGAPESVSIEAQLTGRAPWTWWEVPYRFCSDEYLFGTSTCHAYDMGADSYEIVVDAIQRYWSYYWFNNFQRDRVFFDEWSYMDDMYWRYFGFIHNAFQHWIFDEWFTAPVWDFLAETEDGFAAEDETWRTAANGGLAATAAAREGLIFLQQVLAVPEPGAYWYDFDEGYYWAFSEQAYPICETDWAWNREDYCADSVIDLGSGRYFLTVYDWESGYTFYERLKWIGSFYDKLLALETLTNPDTYFLGVDTSQSVDQWAISMYLAFPKEIHQIFAGIAADRYDLFAGYIDEDWQYQPPNPFETDPEVIALATDNPVDPQTSFTIQLYALWYGMAWLNANFDNRFNDLAKIWIKGSGEAITPPEGTPLIEYTDPFNSRTYVALVTDAEARLGVGWALLDQANKAVDVWKAAVDDPESTPDWIAYLAWRIENFTSNIEVVRGLHSLYGTMFF